MMSDLVKKKLGTVERKILLLLGTGIALGLTQRPDYYFRIIENFAEEWREINRRSLRDAIRRLYKSKMIDLRENKDGTVTVILENNGKKEISRYNLEELKIPKPARWDGYWRMVIFDIPEHKKQGRDALSAKLKMLGLHPLQKSVFIFPYDCYKEIEFVAEIFKVRPYVRFILAKEIDVALDLKQRFDLF